MHQQFPLPGALACVPLWRRDKFDQPTDGWTRADDDDEQCDSWPLALFRGAISLCWPKLVQFFNPNRGCDRAKLG